MKRELVRTPDGAELELFTSEEGAEAGAPGVVVVIGSLVTAADYAKFAKALSEALRRPIHVLNRRGQGDSTPQTDSYSLEQDVADLRAVLEHTDTRDIFGHSFGGALVLHAARSIAVDHLAVYDPAVSIDGSVQAPWIDEYQAAHDAGDTDKALAIVLRGLEPRGPISRIPLHMLTLGNKLTAGTDFGKELREQLPNGVREIKAVIAADMSAEPFLELPLETLILVGEKSPAYFGVACGRLHDVLSGSSYSVVPGLGHDGVNRAPARLVEQLAEFFAG
ncbi:MULTISPECIES: alpha/beta hydrolase [Arthrobacter]|uniref:Alpha/beta hydrolase n=2 Tax=Arthrobacter TaxID=1663 RepID=A0ABU9KIP6_9MICC|nr:alpha/beta hydrolase [Arthrobacter sp. YJM1]MDP5227000.1 alpha/beta hydrolase [Arthrobacter sp. YJM1]